MGGVALLGLGIWMQILYFLPLTLLGELKLKLRQLLLHEFANFLCKSL